ncbi:MAG: family 2 glycosyl transferase [Parcubacteria group bacterium Gr01-1014_18]|nr:MAG: family 2 glycosyl transferase [Parcubacteria group bacterium Greene0416_36]TSC81310.1 MAG: family 2 glycosyl transferase [Parcubacteria group bacterium Gr01-1014_18]TSC99332.1 MAG: family 2 glycosyl transferase [Parcubacteria group bacterium Greene1014_20]TSD06831.1 MAG: family 2 glycosyl transferase [Parcubacteria group bacterium Greene0714_2]
MDLSIIILNYKSSGLCRTAIRGIEKIPHKISYEIIVVDNDSRDGLDQIMKDEFPHIRFIQSGKNLGHPAGNNLGISASSGRYVMILNADIAVLDNAFDKVVEYMDAHPQVGASACRLMNPDGTLQYSCRRFYRMMTPLYSRTFLGKTRRGDAHMRDFLMIDYDHSKSGPVDWLQGSCLLLRRSVLQKIGAMDERFFLYFGDVDWCRRVWNSGHEVHYIANASIVHYFHRESRGGMKMLLNPVGRLHIRDWVAYLRKY